MWTEEPDARALQEEHAGDVALHDQRDGRHAVRLLEPGQRDLGPGGGRTCLPDLRPQRILHHPAARHVGDADDLAAAHRFTLSP
jgi:hypothetical protein